MDQSPEKKHRTPSSFRGWQKDLILSFFFGIIAAVANCSLLIFGIPSLQWLAAITLYIAALCYPLRIGLMTTLLYTLSIPYCSSAPWLTFRLSIFAILLALTTTDRFAYAPSFVLPPFFTTTMLWTLLILANTQGLLPASLGVSLSNKELVTLMPIEIMASLMIVLACCSKKINIFLGQKSKTVTLVSWLTHVIALVILGIFFCAGLLHANFKGQPLSGSLTELITSLDIQDSSVLIVIVLTATLALLTAWYLTSSLKGCIQQIRLCTEANNRLLVFSQEPVIFKEFQEAVSGVRTDVDKLIAELQENKLHVKDLHLEIESTQKKLREKLQLIQNIGTLLDEAPWGFLGLTAEGLIVEASKKFCEFLKLDPAQVWEKDFDNVFRNQPSQQELRAILFQVFQDFTTSVGQLKRYYSSPIENGCLEVLVLVHNEISLPSLRVQGEPSITRSDIGVSVYVRKISDTKDLQLQMLAPSVLELIGGQVIESAMQLDHHLRLVTQYLNVLHPEMDNNNDAVTSTQPSEDSKAVSHVLTSLAQARQLTSESLEIIEYLVYLSANQEGIQERMSINKLVQQGLNYLYDVALFEQPLKLILPEVEKRKPSKASTGRIILRDADLARIPEIYAKANRGEIVKFFGFFLNLLKNIHPRAPEMEISLADEHIENTTAGFIPGSHPGYYARLVITHRGRSITANMLSGKLRNIHLFGNESESIEAALTMLHFQARRLGGFLSVQSTPTKGTSITIYIPAEEDKKAILRKKQPRQETPAQEATPLLSLSNDSPSEPLPIQTQEKDIPSSS